MKYILLALALSACSSGSNSPPAPPILSVKLSSPALNIEGFDNNYHLTISNSGGEFQGSILVNQTSKSCGIVKSNSSCSFVFTTKEKISHLEVLNEKIELVSFSSQEMAELKRLITNFKEGDFYQDNTNFDLILNLKVLNYQEDLNLRNKLNNLSNINWSPTINSPSDLPFYFFNYLNLQNQDLNTPEDVYLRIWDLNEIILENGGLNEDIFISKLSETLFLLSTLRNNQQFEDLSTIAGNFYLHYLASFSQRNYVFNNSLRQGNYNYSFDSFSSCRSLRYKIDLFNFLGTYLPSESLLEVEFLTLLLSLEDCPVSQIVSDPSLLNLKKVKEILTSQPFSGSLRDLIDFMQFIDTLPSI